MTAVSQFPAQLPTALQNETSGNVASLISFALGNKDAQVVRKELLTAARKKDRVETAPIEASELLELPVGTAYGKFAGGRAVKIEVAPPRRIGNRALVEEVIRDAWLLYDSPPSSAPEPEATSSPHAAREPESFLE